MRRLLLLYLTLSLLPLHASYAQVSLVKGFPGVPTSAPIVFEPLNNLMLFNQENGLWKSDGTTAGTTVLNATVGFPSDFKLRCNVGNTIFFVPTFGQLWKTNGTAAGTVLVKNIGTQCENLVNLNGLLLFTSRGSTSATLWQSDGTEAGTTLVTNLDGVSNGFASLLNTAVLDGYLYFSGPAVSVPGFGSQPEVWRTNGTAAGTTRVADGGYSPRGFNVIGNKLIYAAQKLYPGACPSDPTSTRAAKVIMRVEGTTVSVLRESATVTVCSVQRPLGNTFLNTNKFIKAGNYLYFRGQEESSNNYNLWTTDGTTVTKLTNFNASTPGDGLTNFFWDEGINDFGYGAVFLFPLITANQGTELWRSDGTINGTYLAKDINSGTGGSTPGHFRTAGGITYFFASDGTRGPELWKSDGTTGGTVLVEAANRAVQPVELNDVPTNTYGHSVGNRYYFSGNYTNLQGLYTPCNLTAPTLTASPSNQVCPGGSATISASGCAGTVIWSTGATGVSITVTPQQSTTYSAVCTLNNCVSPASTTITIFSCAMYTTKIGNWNDPSVWSENRVPGPTDTVTINHTVTLPGNYMGQVRRIAYTTVGRLLFGASSRLNVFGN